MEKRLFNNFKYFKSMKTILLTLILLVFFFSAKAQSDSIRQAKQDSMINAERLKGFIYKSDTLLVSIEYYNDEGQAVKKSGVQIIQGFGSLLIQNWWSLWRIDRYFIFDSTTGQYKEILIRPENLIKITPVKK